MKRWKNLVLAAIMSVAIGIQSVVPVQAAVVSPMSTDVWVCADCKEPVSVSEVRRIKEITIIGDCTLREHQSIGCKICDITYVVETWISCSRCPHSELQSDYEKIERNKHRCFA